ncbi:MAG: hypothetical protein AAF092_14510 [Pseudomonadota bacterium]
MSSSPDPKPASSLQGRPAPKADGASAVELIAILLSAMWLVGSGVFFLAFDGTQALKPEAIGQLSFVMVLLSVFLPVVVFWVAASAARSARVMREESQRLQAAIDAMRKTYLEDRETQKQATPTTTADVEQMIDEIAQVAKQTEDAIATFTTQRKTVAPAAPVADGDDQPALALGTPPGDLPPPLETDEFIRALNFPETEEDQAGFAALRAALRHREAATLIQASQDVLTLLSQEGIYMDDYKPDRARPEVWRRFADGERGRAVASLGGIRDRSSLALTAGRMRSDPIFRDAVHHFLRHFDKMLISFVETAEDRDLAAMAETRTARAFMLLGRVTGMFS